jgi:hypothetical protein
MIRQFAKILGADEGYLFVLAGKIPDDVRQSASDPTKISAAFTTFRELLAS